MPAMTNDSTPTRWRPSMTDRSDGYVTDTVYTWGFYGDMSPFNLNYIAMMHGFAPVDLDRQFSYLELGCGNGVSANIFAACHPAGQFHAVDLNPEHIDNARAMADGGMLSNIHVHNTPFGELDLGALPMFDFIVLHGIYSWVAPKVRSEIIRIIKNKLTAWRLCLRELQCPAGRGAKNAAAGNDAEILGRQRTLINGPCARRLALFAVPQGKKVSLLRQKP